MYDGKLGMHLPSHFDLTGNTPLFNAWKLWLNVNYGYACTYAGRETITSPIRPFMKFTLDSIRKKLWKTYNTGWRKVLMKITGAPGNESVSKVLSNEGGHIKKQISNHLLTLYFSIL